MLAVGQREQLQDLEELNHGEQSVGHLTSPHRLLESEAATLAGSPPDQIPLRALLALWMSNHNEEAFQSGTQAGRRFGLQYLKQSCSRATKADENYSNQTGPTEKWRQS